MSDWPTVSVVVPLRDEASHLEDAVTAILEQEYPVPFDVCLAVAPSSDATEEIARSLAEREPRISVVRNPSGTTPAGLNLAIRSTTGEVVVRVDGHSRLSPGYIRRAVETIRRTGAVNVGGIQAATGETPFEEVVANAMTSIVGTGGARFHVGGREGPVDTVYLGVFDRAAGDAVGWFDESLVRNQDYELNVRLRAAGGTVWFDPALSVSYRPRGSLRALARQYHEYGLWKAEVLRRHPDSVKLRQVLPPLAVGAMAASTLASPWSSIARRIASIGALAWCGAGWSVDRRRTPLAVAVLATMHVAWATGIARGALRDAAPASATPRDTH